ncbi:hypothetical protein SLA2020_060640 [Shorea laevis]
MYDEMKSASASDAPAEMSVSSAAAESLVGSSDDEMQFLSDAIRSLPSYAVKDLLSVGVCVRCSFRLVGIEQQIYCSSSFSPSLLAYCVHYLKNQRLRRQKSSQNFTAFA